MTSANRNTIKKQLSDLVKKICFYALERAVVRGMHSHKKEFQIKSESLFSYVQIDILFLFR